MLKRFFQLISLAALISVTGCTSLGVEPWDRDILA